MAAGALWSTWYNWTTDLAKKSDHTPSFWFLYARRGRMLKLSVCFSLYPVIMMKYGHHTTHFEYHIFISSSWQQNLFLIERFSSSNSPVHGRNTRGPAPRGKVTAVTTVHICKTNHPWCSSKWWRLPCIICMYENMTHMVRYVMVHVGVPAYTFLCWHVCSGQSDMLRILLWSVWQRYSIHLAQCDRW